MISSRLQRSWQRVSSRSDGGVERWYGRPQYIRCASLSCAARNPDACAWLDGGLGRVRLRYLKRREVNGRDCRVSSSSSSPFVQKVQTLHAQDEKQRYTLLHGTITKCNCPGMNPRGASVDNRPKRSNFLRVFIPRASMACSSSSSDEKSVPSGNCRDIRASG